MDKTTAKKENMLTVGMSLISMGMFVMGASTYQKITDGKDVYWGGLFAGIIVWAFGLATIWLRGIFKSDWVQEVKKVVTVEKETAKKEDNTGEVEDVDSKEKEAAEKMNNGETLDVDEMRKRMEID